MYIEKIVSIICLITFVNKYPYLKKYKQSTKFAVYRSLMCLFFTLGGIETFIYNINSYFNNIGTITEDSNEIGTWFQIYLLIDIIICIKQKNKRIDLYINHIICFLGFLSCENALCMSTLLIAEIISIVSGLDQMAIENNDNELSLMFKKFRIFMIKYIRFPIWALSIFMAIYHKKKIKKRYFFTAIALLPMILLDEYWYRKTNKIINKINIMEGKKYIKTYLSIIKKKIN